MASVVTRAAAAAAAKPTLHLVRAANVPIFDMLQLEEALFRNDERNWCAPHTRLPMGTQVLNCLLLLRVGVL